MDLDPTHAPLAADHSARAAGWWISAGGTRLRLRDGWTAHLSVAARGRLRLSRTPSEGAVVLRVVGGALKLAWAPRGVSIRARGVILRRGSVVLEGALTVGDDVLVVGREAGLSRYPDAVSWLGMVGRDVATVEMFDTIAKVGRSDLGVWVIGETGVGKELVARAIHAASPRADGPWFALNCAALADNLAESELFGAVRGAFTGATRDRSGAFVAADGGTLFLDEIAELPMAMQAKLLRVLETGEVRPVGADRARTVDVRVIAASWRDLEEAAAQGTFRADLLHRLWVMRVAVPPLRDRPADIGPLLDRFLGDRGAALWPPVRALGIIERARWPGNVRELRNHARRAVAMGDPGELAPSPLDRLMSAQVLPRRGATSGPWQHRLIQRTLQRHRGNRTASARALGVSRSTLYRWLRDGRSEGAGHANHALVG